MKTFKLPSMKHFKVDWTNHIVGFVSTLLGIFIAFQLDDWQDRKAQEERIEITLGAIKKEVDSNIAIYKINISKLSQWIEYCEFIQNHSNENGEVISTESALNSIKIKNQHRFKDLKVLKKHNDSLNVYKIDLMLDVLPETDKSTNNWEAAKSSGILNYMDHSRMAQLTQIYDWINKDLGVSDSDIYKNIIKVNQFTDIPTLIQDYKMIVRVSEMKLSRIEEYYKKMDWE